VHTPLQGRNPARGVHEVRLRTSASPTADADIRSLKWPPEQLLEEPSGTQQACCRAANDPETAAAAKFMDTNGFFSYVSSMLGCAGAAGASYNQGAYYSTTSMSTLYSCAETHLALAQLLRTHMQGQTTGSAMVHTCDHLSTQEKQIDAG
jgi:hypothetical protein